MPSLLAGLVEDGAPFPLDRVPLVRLPDGQAIGHVVSARRVGDAVEVTVDMPASATLLFTDRLTGLALGPEQEGPPSTGGESYGGMPGLLVGRPAAPPKLADLDEPPAPPGESLGALAAEVAVGRDDDCRCVHSCAREGCRLDGVVDHTHDDRPDDVPGTFGRCPVHDPPHVAA